MLLHRGTGGQKKEAQHKGGVKETERDHVAAFQVSFGWQQGHGNEHWFSHEQREDGYVRAAEAGSPWARRRNPPPPWGILGTYIVLKHSLRVFQIRLFALLKWRRLAVRPHSLCEAKKTTGCPRRGF